MEAYIGSIVKFRERLWVLMPSDDQELLLLRPLTGSQDELVAVHRKLSTLIGSTIPEERIEPAIFPLPTIDDVSDAVGAHLLHLSARLTLREGAAPFRSLGRISIRPRPYQLVPLLMALRMNPVRLLIADDVGVGKTIEALLIARELYDRGEIKRLAVLCPPYLCEQWQKELSEKFNFNAVIIRSGTIGQLERKTPPSKSIYSFYPFQVISIDFIKSERNKHQFLIHPPDMVIVDEVHGATDNSENPQQQQRHRFLKELISHRPDIHLVLLTATPHSGIETAFRSLLSLLNPKFANWDTNNLSEEQIDELSKYFIQRTRKDIMGDWEEGEKLFPERLTSDSLYHLSPLYKKLFQETYNFCSEIVRTGETLDQRRRRVRYWGALSLLRCVMSSPEAARKALQLRREGKETLEEEAEEDFASSVFEPSDEFTDDSQPTTALEAIDLTIDEKEKLKLKQLERIAEEIINSEEDWKLRECIKLVRELLIKNYKPIVWCRYIATAEYVAEKMQEKLSREFPDIKVTAITGLIGDEERKAKVEELGQFERRVLVATDCLSEGINLQDWFTAVIHYDLPWNPNKMEQREGRVDRYGQKATRVKAIRFYSPDNPIDGIVIRVLLDKAKQIHNALGTYVPVPQDSESIIEAVLRSLFLRYRSLPLQLSLDFFPAEVEELHKRWELDEKRERRNRTKFAQRALKPAEVMRELEKTDAVLGEPDEVRQFVLNACQRLDIRVEQDRHPDVYRLIPLNELPPLLRNVIPEKKDGWRISFRAPTPSGAEYIGRNHRFVQALSQFLLEEALTSKGRARASRAGAIRTKAVEKLTVILLLRARYLLKQAGRPLFSEEVLVRAYTYESPTKISWLSPDGSLNLLAKAKPDENIPLSEKKELVAMALSRWKDLEGEVREILQKRADELLESHKRIRRTLAMEVRKLEMVPQFPPDLLGLLVLQPVVRV
ncbi:DEAD/DEAH box helicase [bacterium]|nr:DEAD/DEAH box helicase [bacterium]